MNILIIGSGAREVAIARACKRSSHHPTLFFAMTHRNPDLIDLSHDIFISDMRDCQLIVKRAVEWKIDLAIIGPETPLEKGLADLCWQNKIPTIGPTQSLARIETSKAFARFLMKKYNILGLPRYQFFETLEGVYDCLRQFSETGFVIKEDGLANGKGVKVSGVHLADVAEGYEHCIDLIEQQKSFLIEEKCVGEEFSLMAFCDGESLVFMPPVQDYKRAWINDTGPNTGGMGSISASNHLLPFLTEQDLQTAKHICHDVIKYLQMECGEKYRGILYGGFMVTAKGISVIEFNARFGDSESINALALLESDFVEICLGMINGQLAKTLVHFAKKSTVCKYAVPEGYPEYPISKEEIHINVDSYEYIYCASVDRDQNKLMLIGSRAVAVLGMADTLDQAEKIAESQIIHIQGPLYHRADIGTQPMIQKRVENMNKLRAVTA